MKIHFLGVGNGDCTILELPDNSLMIVDIMNARMDYSHRSEFTNPIHYLKKIRPIDTIIHRYIQTHPDLDHMDGLSDLLQSYSITNFWDTQNNRPTPEEYFGAYREKDWYAYQEIRKGNSVKLYTRSLDKIRYTDGVTDNLEYNYDLYSFSPTDNLVAEANKNQNWNLLSHIILLSYKDFKLLLSGDADDAAWVNILNWISLDGNAKDLLSNVTLFKAAHHGRLSSYCGAEMLRILNPNGIIVSSDFVPSDESAKSNYRNFLSNKGKGEFLYETEKGTITAEYNEGSNTAYINQELI